MRWTLLLLATLVCGQSNVLRAEQADVVVYGGTAGGVAAAIQVVRMGKTVILIEPTHHIGGLTSGGLGFTDSGNKEVIGGISQEFYARVKKFYDYPANWTFGKRDDYKNYRAAEATMWTFEPRIAEKILREMLAEAKIKVVEGERLDRAAGKGVTKEGQRIVSIAMESGRKFEGSAFIDATYEGDLMAAAGVSYATGREANSKYNETINGVVANKNLHSHRFVKNVDPFVKAGDPKSGLLFGIETKPLPPDGEGDQRLQAYCFRMCMCFDPKNRVPFPKPADYDEAKYELLFRNFEAGDLRFPMKPDMMPNGKTDTNNNCAVSTDYIGQNYKYADGSYAEREKIIKEHETYQKGLMWALANHPRVPESIRHEMAKWGLARDEFTDNGNWPHQIYVREARRLVSDFIMTERTCTKKEPTPMPVGMGSYNMDSHNCSRYVTKEGFVQNEGDVQTSPGGPYSISYLSLVPKKGECENLVVPVCCASSHIAYGSIRMEPVFMILGQSAATGAVLALNGNIPVQAVKYEALREKLLADKQVLEWKVKPGQGAIDPKTLKGIVIDDDQAAKTGFGAFSSATKPYVGAGYSHDANGEKGKQWAVYTPDLSEAGDYEVRISYPPASNRATNVPVTVKFKGGEKTVAVNERKEPSIDKSFVSLGTYAFEKGKSGSVTISNKETDGYVVIDAVQWLRK